MVLDLENGGVIASNESNKLFHYLNSRPIKSVGKILELEQTIYAHAPTLLISLCAVNDCEKDKSLFYLLLAGGGEELVAAGGASTTPTRANVSIAIFQVPLSLFSILNQLPLMVLSLTVIE